MGINVSAAYARARELRTQAQSLRSAKTNMTSYKNLLANAWQGTEMTYYQQAIANVENRLSSAASTLESLAYSIEVTARQIRQEEIEEEQRRQAALLAEQQRLKEAEST